MECPILSGYIGTPSLSTKVVPLSDRHLFLHNDQGLCGVTGAQKIISLLSSQRSGVTKIQLNHNALGDDGICLLFAYLASPEGSRHRATLLELSLTGNNIGCRGMHVIIKFIHGNGVLRTLWVAHNELTSDPDVSSRLADALNNSRLHFLSLTGNLQLGDGFLEYFLPFLHSRSLRELHINDIGLTPRSVSVIATWISCSAKDGQGACYLQTFKCSGNSLSVRGVWEVVRAIEMGNWALSKVELYANQLAGPRWSASANASLCSERETEVGCARELRKVVMRNDYWKRRTEKEALNLLRYARPLLMRSNPLTTLDPFHRNSPDPSLKLDTNSPFFALPNELKMQILALFAPSLSSAQRVRIYNYASDPATLPSLTPTLRRETIRGCLVDPSVFSATVGPGVLVSGCPEGKCMGANSSLVCRREEERYKFLEAVGCCSYEPELDRLGRTVDPSFSF